MRGSAFHGLVVLLIVVLASGGPARAGEPPGGSGVVAQATLGAAFTYQGFLKQGGSPANGTCDLRFILYDSDIGGSQVGSTVSSSNVAVAGGLFTTQLDFGAGPFNGQARWLETAVRCPPGSGDLTTLSPRQALAAAPYALYATVAGSAASATSAASAPWSGLTGVPAGFSDGADDVGWSLSGNSGTSASSFLGTTDNMTVTLAVNGTAALRLVPTAGTVPTSSEGSAAISLIRASWGQP